MKRNPHERPRPNRATPLVPLAPLRVPEDWKRKIEQAARSLGSASVAAYRRKVLHEAIVQAGLNPTPPPDEEKKP